MKLKQLLVLTVLLAGCSAPGMAAPSPLPPSPAITAVPASPLPVPVGTGLAVSVPLATPASSATPLPTATPRPFAEYEIDALRSRPYGTGPIEILQTLEETPNFTRQLIAYPSDDLRITGMMNLPKGEGPFPVVILNHGYFDPAGYTTGRGTQPAADYLANRGYLTIAPDYRYYAGSGEGANYFRNGYAIDVLNLVGAVKHFPLARPDAIGMWGHSMGGGITQVVMVVCPDVKAFVLYGSMSGDMTQNYYRIAHFRGQTHPGDDFSPVTPEQDPELFARTSPVNYLDAVRVPVLIHHGELDDTVPPDWSVDLAARLTALGRDVTLHIYSGAGHSFWHQTWILFMQRTVGFFDEHLLQAGG